MLSSQSGKLITLAALPTHSTTIVASIYTRAHAHAHTNRTLLRALTADDVFEKYPFTRRKKTTKLTCPIPTHTDEGNLTKGRGKKPLVGANMTAAGKTR